MADVSSNIKVNVDTTEAIASLKNLQRQISAFHTSMAKGGAAANAVAGGMQQNLINSINATGKFQANMRKITSTSEAFNDALAKNQLSMKQYFRYAGAATQTFGKLFAQEHATINKVARENVKNLQTQYIKMGRDANGALRAIAIKPLALDMKSLATQTQLAAQKQALLNQLLKQGSTNLINFGKNTQWAGRQLMVGFTVPLMYFGTAAARVFMKLEEQAIRFKRVYGDMFTTTTETNKALKEIQLLANEFTKYGVAVEKTMEMAATAAATGKVGAELTAQVREATRLAVLGGVEQEQSLDTIISLTNTFGIAAEDLATNIDFLNSVENQTILSIEDLTIAIPKAAPIIKQLGGDVKDLAFFMTAMKEGGINASEGANALKSGLASIINPSDKASKFLQGFGINLKNIVEADKGNVKKTILDVAAAFNTLDPLNRSRAIEQLFGKFQFARISTLFQNVIQEGTQAQRVMELSNATSEELAILSERELKNIEDSPMYKFKKTVEDLKVTLAPIGAEFLKALTPVVKFFGSIFEHFNDMGDGTKKFVVLLTTLLAGVGPIVLMTFGLLANGVGNIIKLFTFMRGVFSGTGKQTKVLGEETAFMTQQQIQAAAVASSLDQAHQKLQQRFTSEATAVNELTLAYQRAIAAQKLMVMPGLPGRGAGKGTKKYVDGVVSVPGPKGAGDVVPAMLSPGESVIPADMTAKYAPLIQGMVAGTIPGYETGRVGSGSEGRIGKANTTVMRPYGANVANSGGLVGFTSINPKNAADVTSIYTKEIIKASGVSTKSIVAEIKRWETANRVAIDRATAAVNAGANATTAFAPLVEKFRVDMQRAEGPFAKFAATATTMGPMLEADLIQAQNEAKRMGLNMKSAADAAALARALPNNMVAQSMNTPGAFGGLSRIRAGASAMFGGVKDIARAGIPRFMLTPGIHPSTPAYKGATSQEHFSTTTKQEEAAAKARIKRAEANGKKEAEAHNRGVKSAAKDPYVLGRDRNSPHALAGKDGTDDGKAYSAAKANAIRTAPMPPSSQSQMAATSKTRLYGTGPIDPEAKSVRRQLQTLDKQKLQESKRQLALDKKISQSKQQLYGTTGEITRDMRVQRKLRESQERALAAAERARIAEERAMAASTRKNRIQEWIASRRKVQATDAATVAQSGGMMGKAQGAMMGASMVAMMGSMAPGKVGEVSQKLIMPLMGMSMVLPMLQSKFGALAVGVGAVVAAYAYLRMAFDKAQDSTMALAEATGAGTSAMIELSKSAGKVSATEAMDRRRKDKFTLIPIQTGKSTFGQSFVQQGVGKTMVQNIGKNIAENTPQVAKQQTANQLANAVASGAMTADQAKSVAQELGKQLGDYNFGIQVIGQLESLIGLDGKDILENPLEVRVRLIEESRKNLGNAATSNRVRGGWTGKDLGQTAAGAGIGAGVGAIGGAIAGGIIGSLAGPGGTAAGAIIGAKVGAVVGTVAGGLIGKKARNERIAKASGASVAMDKMALEQGQQMIDSFDIQYQKKIELLKAQGKINEAVATENRYYREREDLISENNKTKGIILDNYNKAQGESRKAYETGVDKSITKKYKGTIYEDMVGEATSLVGDSKLNAENKMSLKLEMESGAIDPMQMIQMFNTFTTKKDQQRMLTIIGKFGGKFASETVNVVNGFTDSKGNVVPSLQSKYTVQLNAKTTNKEAQDFQNFFGKLDMYDNVIDAAISVDYFLKNPTAQADLNKIITDIEKTGGVMDIKVAAGIVGGDALKALTADADYFNSLDKNQKIVYTTALATQLSLEGDPDQQKAFKAWQKAQPGGKPSDYLTYSTTQATAITKGAKAAGLIPTGGGSGGGSKVESSILDDLLRKLKELRKVQIKVTEGWAASKKALNSLFGGNKELKIFEGLDQQMRKRGAGEDLITLIAGMDPKEYEKRKNDLFEFDKKGNIVKLKQTALSAGKALQEISLGSFQNEQQSILKNTGNQTIAVNRLIAAGVDAKTAYEGVADAAFAAAIANKKLSAEELNKIVSAWKKAEKAKKDYLAAQGVKESNQDFTDQVTLLKKMGSMAGKFTNEQMNAILNDKNLQRLAVDPTIDPAAFKKAMENAAKKADVEIAMKSLTIEGMTDIFNDGFGKAMEAFAAEEKNLQLQFEFKTKGDKEVISKAENDIARINFQLDDYDAGLQQIDEQTEDINKKYDKQFEALDKISEANSIIAGQQQRQLTLADALSQGDISAAAKIAQDNRAKNAEDQMNQTRKAMESARDLEIERLTVTVMENGKQIVLTRAQIEERSKALRKEIFDIEEKTLEPATERVRLAQVELDKQIAGITVLGKTKLEWESIQNGIDLAKTRSAEYQAAIQKALDVVKDILNYWTNLDGKHITTYHDIITTYITGGGGGGGGGGSSTANPGNIDAVNTQVSTDQQKLLDSIKNGTTTDVTPSSIANDMATKLLADKDSTAALGGVSGVLSSARYTGQALVWAAKQAAEERQAAALQKLKEAESAAKATRIGDETGWFGLASGGMVPKYFAVGGMARGTDTVPAMLTPGEFVMSKYAVKSYGLDTMKAINSGSTSVGDSVYNYSLSVNVKSDANPDEIARTVMMQIKQIDAQRIRGNRN